MLRISLVLFGVAMLLGFVLAALNLRSGDKAPPCWRGRRTGCSAPPASAPCC